jgi:putative ABC transport system permease protein
VLGASVADIAALLSKDFLEHVAFSIVTASPAAWWIMNKWSQGFSYRTNMSRTVFLIRTAGLY